MRLPHPLLGTTLLAGAVALLAPPSAAQSTSIVLRKGQPILGAGGDVKSFKKIAVTDTGVFFANVATTGPGSSDDVILLNGFLSIPEGAQVGQPTGALIQSFLDLDVNSFGFVGWPLDLDTGSNDDDAGIYWNTLLLSQEGQPVVADNVMGTPLTAGTVYDRFNVAKINDRNSVLWSGKLDDPSFNGSEDSLVLIKTDGAGVLVSEEILLMQDYPLQLTGETVSDVGDNPHLLSLNNADEYLVMLKVDINDTENDSMLLKNGEILVREGEPAGLGTRVWTDLGGVKLNMNDFGETITTAFMDGNSSSNATLLYNGQIYAQEGQVYPAIAPFAVSRFDASPQFIGNCGNLYWYVKSNEGTSTDQYILRNQDVIIQENVTTVDGETITFIKSVSYSYHVSNSGRFLVADVQNGNSDSMMILADFGTHFALPGCEAKPASLTKISGEAQLGSTIFIEMDGGQGVGVLPIVYWSLGNGGDPALSSGVQCGRPSPFGELMVDFSPAKRLGVQRPSPFNGNPITLQIDIPNDPALVNLRAYGQGLFWDVGDIYGGPTFALTDGYYVEIGAP